MSKLIRLASALALGLCLCGTAVWAQSTMTDDQVLEYVQQGVASGKGQEEMIAELTLRGVTKDQAMRVYNMYLSQQEGGSSADLANPNRAHTVDGEVDAPQTPETIAEPEVFGRNIFRNKGLNFAPSENLATPRNYRLGPGDEVIIDVFGRNQTTVRGKISPEGSINVDILGPLYLSGMTIEEANKYLKKRLSHIYGGLGRQSDTDMRLSLGQIRTIQVNVVGDVANAGTYVVSAFATAFHALYIAGGVVNPGTLRDIQVVRAGKEVGRIDVYDFMLRGTLSSDMRLEEGDVILVNPYKNLVSVEGGVKRPMLFELKDGETLADVIEFAGGFSGGANTDNITVTRQEGKAYNINTVPESQFASFVLRDGDVISVGQLQSRYQNRITINGSVFFPGVYELGEEVRTVKGLVQKAGGLLPEAFSDHVVVNREYDDKTKEVFSLNLTEILAGTKPDFVLKNNDELFITSVPDLKEAQSMSISGMVNNPGSFPFADNTTIEDLIIMAGGLRDGASFARVDVTRRKKDINGTVATSEIGELYSFSIKEGLVAGDDKGFVLEPYDEVVVHQSPSYNIQKHFSVTGEVNFPGQYVLTSRDERVSDLIKKAGGLTAFAYAKGARLIRQATDIEVRQANEMVDIIEQKMDTVELSARKATAGVFTIAIDLDKALSNPGGDEDVVLREGDVLEIPVISNVVRINGAVNYPTAVNYDASLKGGAYIKLAGGYDSGALRSKAYIVNMNGKAKKLRSWTKVDPGAEIYVPYKKKDKKDFNYASIASIASAAASLSTSIMTVIYLVNYMNRY